MEWQRLEYFQTLANVQHMTRAAELLSISQPALSRSIASLEEEIGVPLFDRQGRSIILNRYGTMFLERVNRIMSEMSDGLNDIQQLIDPEQGEITLGFLHTLGTSTVPNIIRAFHYKYPHITFQFKQNHTHTLLKQLKSGELDLCLVASIDYEKPIDWIELWRDELFVIVPIHHPLANRKSISINELIHESFISMKKGYALRKTTDSIFSNTNLLPNIAFEGDEVATVAGFVSAGLGFSILPDGEEINPRKIAKLRIEDMVCERVIGMARVENRYLSPAATNFQQFIFDYFFKEKK
ncbi:LysR family transcriptional regulator [Psychrobacillus lasiicapitis]|uniref:LysR family transcriptional regulator n=1 Tax=Psychrobacillus lasiicapitis TaxID=1636719 RepID=A0A544TH96_9BACI|nr:LysR family transcriptional regulator [Psychrobacillus lasiicapitis]TQR16829.1 LysR family transcriptional regulator [Psychrobacillus lasiicapitis]GGA26804.1 putative HTH-type transcriptional regulator YybE [Psychrobacillus lasiicapitis]